MGLSISLVLLMAVGMGIPFVPETSLRLYYEGAPWLLRLWYGSVTAFAVPLCLLILRATKNRTIFFGSVVWGTWLLVISFVLLIRGNGIIPSAAYNHLAVGFVMVFSLACVIFALLSLRQMAPAKSANKPA